MKNVIKNMPIAISGLLLAIFSLGNLYNIKLISYATFSIGFVILIMCITKALFYHNIIKDELENMVILSTSGTFSMSLMLFSTFINTINSTLAIILWISGIILHSLLIIVFAHKYIFHNFDIENVYASYWVVFVGITMASITGYSFNLQNYTWIFFVFGFIMMLITFPIVTYRYVKYPVKLEQNQPLICIYAAVMNILIVGYFNTFSNINISFVLVLYTIALICYFYSLYKLIGYVRIPFYPSYSAFTFPFVISAIASSNILNLMATPAVHVIFAFQTLVATVMVIYVLYKYVMFILAK
ncbi:MAG TPA: TDT family transporter [Methanosphaera sp.]|nr:TDT family transporter [Methanosphaera sp.]